MKVLALVASLVLFGCGTNDFSGSTKNSVSEHDRSDNNSGKTTAYVVGGAVVALTATCIAIGLKKRCGKIAGKASKIFTPDEGTQAYRRIKRAIKKGDADVVDSPDWDKLTEEQAQKLIESPKYKKLAKESAEVDDLARLIEENQSVYDEAVRLRDARIKSTRSTDYRKIQKEVVMEMIEEGKLTEELAKKLKLID